MPICMLNYPFGEQEKLVFGYLLIETYLSIKQHDLCKDFFAIVTCQIADMFKCCHVSRLLFYMHFKLNEFL